MKNLLLIGDISRSVQFLAFQEDPFKLVMVSRDTRFQSVISANFIYSGEEMGIVTKDREGIIRVWEYDPYRMYLEIDFLFTLTKSIFRCRYCWRAVSPPS